MVQETPKMEKDSELEGRKVEFFLFFIEASTFSVCFDGMVQFHGSESSGNTTLRFFWFFRIQESLRTYFSFGFVSLGVTTVLAPVH